MHLALRLAFLSVALGWAAAAPADSSGPRLAAYYDGFMAICGGDAYDWSGESPPRRLAGGARQVAVGRDNRYVLDQSGSVLAWEGSAREPLRVLDRVRAMHAGRSGLLLVRDDGSLWQVATRSVVGFGENLSGQPVRIAAGVVTAAVGDGADYYVTGDGALWVKGRADRGQYGDGKLTATAVFVRSADDVTQVVAHTGHALFLGRDGSVWGTGGNLYGPLGRHGLGDKAAAWGKIFDDARAIATGASHSVAIRRDGSLWIWGRNESLDPRQVMDRVEAVAAGSDTTIAIGGDALWQWRTGARPRRVMACSP